MEKGSTIYSSDNFPPISKGLVITGNPMRCQMEGCNGRRYAVRWQDNKITYPCSKVITEIDKKTYKIA